jgi:hypothetical protein
MGDTILFCTVGGSRDPVVRAIKDHTPTYVVFVCSSGPKSSRPQVEGEDGTPGIAADAGLPSGGWEIVEVPPDNPDEVFLKLEEQILGRAKERRDARIIVDYTGGTKSMSVGAALAALAGGVEISLVTGERPDLVKVASGTERVTPIGFRGVHARFALERAEDAWSRFAYADAAQLLEHAHRDLTLAGEGTKSVRELRARIGRLLAASRMFDAWDRFDHSAARYVWKNDRLDQLPGMSPYGNALAVLDSDDREPLVLLDLWYNAERRAHRKRYDDALARLYRLVEWTAQFLLRSLHRIETGRFDPARLPEGELRARLAARSAKDGTVPIGLFDALAVLRQLSPGHPFVRRLEQALGGTTPLANLQAWIEHRNRSILAHGFVPVDEKLWTQARDWMQACWLPWLQDELAGRGLDLPQFPRSFPA